MSSFHYLFQYLLLLWDQALRTNHSGKLRIFRGIYEGSSTSSCKCLFLQTQSGAQTTPKWPFWNTSAEGGSSLILVLCAQDAKLKDEILYWWPWENSNCLGVCTHGAPGTSSSLLLCGWPSSGHMWPFGEWVSRQKTSLYASLSPRLSLTLSSKINKSFFFLRVKTLKKKKEWIKSFPTSFCPLTHDGTSVSS